VKLNPAVSLLSALIFSFILSFASFKIFFIIPVVFLLFLNINRVKQVFKKLIVLNLFIVILALFLYFETNFIEALNLFIRVNLIILFNLLLFIASNGFDIVKGFLILKFPKKFTSSLYFTVKMIFELNLELKNIKTSLKARNFKPKTDIFTYKTYGNIFGLLFLKTITKSNILKDSLLLRGFKNEIFLNYDNSLKLSDYILISLFVLILFLKVIL